MKIDKKRLLEIINEEFDRVRGDQNMEGHMDHTDKEGKMARNQLEHIAKYAMELHQMLEPYGENIQLEADATKEDNKLDMELFKELKNN